MHASAGISTASDDRTMLHLVEYKFMHVSNESLCIVSTYMGRSGFLQASATIFADG